jgi:LuxR family transcriptional regulator, maltose regulon positive regulatory protein
VDGGTHDAAESSPDNRTRVEPDARAAAVGVPAARRRLVPRTALVERLLAATEPVVSVVAPPGYGKTTLLSQWVDRLGPRVAWVSCERADNDPVKLWDDILTALSQVEPMPEGSRAMVAAMGGNLSAVPRLVRILNEVVAPVVLVLDHLEVVTSPHAIASVTELAQQLPPAWRLALASRDSLPLPLARMRVEGRVLEIKAKDLAMSADEAQALLREAGADIPVEQADDLVDRTEGWPAGLYLAALAIESGMPALGFTFTGDDRFVEDYLRSELLGHLSRTEVQFLARTSILDRMTGPLCDALVGGSSSALMLQHLEEHNLLVVPLDRRGEWYRYHHLFRELLQAELQRTAPELVDGLHSRAATWYAAHGMPEAAIDHAALAGDTERAARIVLDVMQPVWAGGRVETVRSWMELLDGRTIGPYAAAVAAHGALIFALLGRPRETERWVAVAEGTPAKGTLPDGNTVAAVLAYLEANLCRSGPERMRSDATAALEGLSPTSPYRATMLHVQALSFLLDGDLDEAERLFTYAYDLAVGFDSSPLVGMILAEQSLVAMARDERDQAETLVKRAVDLVETAHLEAYWTSALVFAVAARGAVRRGDLGDARRYLGRAARLRPLLTYALPVVSVQTLVELAHAYLGITDPAGALAVLEQAEDIVRRRPGLGTLPAELSELRERVDQITRAAPVGTSSLTTAELRLVPLLATHLSLREIANQLYVSPHTVRTQVKSIYRKLGVSSRGGAVEVLADLGHR